MLEKKASQGGALARAPASPSHVAAGAAVVSSGFFFSSSKVIVDSIS
jgi:hypothetical protein